MSTVDRGRVYAETRARVVDVIRSLSPDELGRRLPTLPDWSPRDVVAHLTGVAGDFVAGNSAGAGHPDWTAAQVESRRQRTLEEVLAEWERWGAAIEPVLVGAAPEVGDRIISDAFGHEQDIRGGTGRPGGRESAGCEATLRFLVADLGRRLEAANLPALRLRTGAREWTTGPGEAAVTVTAPDAFELVRALHGRRSRAQVASGLRWDGASPDRYLDHFSRFPMAERDIME